MNEHSFASEAAAEIVIVDGHFSRQLSSLRGLPRGVDVLDLLEAAKADRALVQHHMGRYADVEKNPFVSLNTAFIFGGVLLRVADVTQKEGRRLVVVPRETPLSAIHLENLLRLAQRGVRIVPPMPNFYQRPTAVAEVVDFVAARALVALGVAPELDAGQQWQGLEIE